MNEFVPDIEVNFPIDITQGAFGDEHNVEFRLGALIETRQVVLMSTTLLEGHSFIEGYRGIFDLRFGIRIGYIDKPWNVTAMDYTQGTKRRYIHPNNRETVRSLTVRAIDGLVGTVRPPQITMSTYDMELPDQALVKYRVIESCLHQCGYRTQDAYRGDDGRDRWHFVVAT